MRAPGFYSAAALAALCLTAGLALADPLDVTAFDSLGRFPSGPGVYSIDTSGDPPTLTAPDGTVIAGVVYDGIAVFTFDRIRIGRDMTVTAAGDRPLALLSYSDVLIRHNGSMNASGKNAGGAGAAGAGGPGGGAGGGGTFGIGNPGRGPGGGGPSGGGGFGGNGGGVNGGDSYGDLSALLEGGSGGGAGNHVSPPPGGIGGGGGGGGGAVEVGALGDIIIDGNSITANGGNGGLPLRTGSGGGGGSGGGILLHGDSVRLRSPLQAAGGNGSGGAGGGGGGQVLILTGPGGFHGHAEIDVSGGFGSGGDGAPGTVTIGSLGESGLGGWALGGLGGLVLLDGARRSRRRFRDLFAARPRWW